MKQAPIMLRTALLITAALCGAWTRGAGQTLVHLGPGQVIRVRLHDGRSVQGVLAGTDTMPPALHFLETPRVVPLADVNALWLRSYATGTGALIGGITVGVVAFAYFSALCGALSEGAGCNQWGVAAYSVPFGAIGALFGALVGSGVERWRPINPDAVTLSLASSLAGWTVAARLRF